MRSFILSFSLGILALGMLTPDAEAARFRRRAAIVPADTYYVPSGQVFVTGPAGQMLVTGPAGQTFVSGSVGATTYYMPPAGAVTPAAAATPTPAAGAVPAAAAPATAAAPAAIPTMTSTAVFTPMYDPRWVRTRRGAIVARRGYWR
jgi:hypothetical protein